MRQRVSFTTEARRTRREASEPCSWRDSYRASNWARNRRASDLGARSSRICLRGVSMLRAARRGYSACSPNAPRGDLQGSETGLWISDGYRRCQSARHRSQDSRASSAHPRSTNPHLSAAEQMQNRLADEFQQRDFEGWASSVRPIAPRSSESATPSVVRKKMLTTEARRTRSVYPSRQSLPGLACCKSGKRSSPVIDTYVRSRDSDQSYFRLCDLRASVVILPPRSDTPLLASASTPRRHHGRIRVTTEARRTRSSSVLSRSHHRVILYEIGIGLVRTISRRSHVQNGEQSDFVLCDLRASVVCVPPRSDTPLRSGPNAQLCHHERTSFTTEARRTRSSSVLSRSHHRVIPYEIGIGLIPTISRRRHVQNGEQSYFLLCDLRASVVRFRFLGPAHITDTIRSGGCDE